MKVLGLNCVGQSFKESSVGSFYTFNPRENKELSFPIQKASLELVYEALTLAEQCASEFAFMTGSKRTQFLFEIANLLDVNRSALCEMFCLESGLPNDRANAELNRTIFQLKQYGAAILDEHFFGNIDDEGDLSRVPNPKPSLRKRFTALGPVVVFGASNFPFAYSTVGGDTASALAAGCPVIVKAHPYHAGTGDLVSQLVAQAAKTCRMPKGVFSNLNDDSFEVAQYLVKHPLVKAAGFTGSFDGGMALHQLAGQRSNPIPVFAEMGSCNPIFIFQSAFSENGLAEKIGSSIALNAGQFCTNPGLIFIKRSEQSTQFVEQLARFLEKQEAQCMLHPNIWRRYAEASSKISGEKIKNVVKTNDSSFNSFYPQLKLTDSSTFIENPNLQDEVFGSHTLVVELSDEEEFDLMLAELHGQLTASIFCAEEKLSEKRGFIQSLTQKAGRIILNGVPTGVEVSQAMHHGGPFPATSDSRFTAVGSDAIRRFLRPLCYQNFSTEIVRLLHN